MTWKFYTTSGQIKQGSSALGTDIPIGTILPYGRTVAPAGWLICDGTPYSTTTYSALFGEIAYAYGGAGASFNVPDLRGRVPVGRTSGGTFPTLGGTGGAETHQLTHLQSGLRDHTHSATTGSNAPNYNDYTTSTVSADHGHNFNSAGASNNHNHQLLNSGGSPMGFLAVVAGPISGGSTGATGYWIGQGHQTYHADTGYISSDHSHAGTTNGINQNHTHTIVPVVNGVPGGPVTAPTTTAHNNLQPYQVVTYIIKALNVVSVELDVNISNLLDVDTTGAADTNTLTYDSTIGSWVPTPNPTPIGTVLDFYGAALPDGFLWCNGAAIPGGFADAIAIIGANTPDLRGRVTAGRDNIGGTDAGRLSISNTMGTTTGTETHALSTAELASHTHTQQGTFTSGNVSSDHTHSVSASGTFHWNQNTDNTHTGAGNFVSGIQTGSLGGNSIPQTVSSTGSTGGISANHTHNTTISGATVAAGSGTAHNNMQPTMVVNKIIRVV